MYTPGGPQGRRRALSYTCSLLQKEALDGAPVDGCIVPAVLSDGCANRAQGQASCEHEGLSVCLSDYLSVCLSVCKNNNAQYVTYFSYLDLYLFLCIHALYLKGFNSNPASN